ncbi:MAG: divergent polysaccharide deacetylase family protein [Clostridia bacterium]|nr:divergent polysaccharide deacetylase family protein [Clostridia bacterium]
MKKKFKFLFLFCTCFILGLLIVPSGIHTQGIAFAENETHENSKPMLAIVIDDFGGYDRSGVKSMLMIEAPLTCAIMPNLENTVEDMENAVKSGKEVILHMPMESHVSLPSDWYGPVYIKNNDIPSAATQKLETCLKAVPKAKGFNIHIGSGVSQNKTLMKAILGYAKEHNLYFLDSRTHEKTICEQASIEENILYLGRDEFLEPNHDKSYAGVKAHIQNGIDLAKEKGHAIIIGHVGAHGGENTAKAIKDMIQFAEDQGVELVTLSRLHEKLKTQNISAEKSNNNQKSSDR